MIRVETQYFNLNRILLLAVGLWPYEQSKLAQFQRIFLFGIQISAIVFQLTTFMTTECTINFIIKVLSSTILFIIFLVKYLSFWINRPILRSSFEQLQYIYNQLKDENETAIIEKYGRNTKHYTIRITLFTVCGLLIFLLQQIKPRVFYIILALNEPQECCKMIQFVTEYFIDQKKYFYLILLHMNVATCTGTFTLIATGTILIGYLKHTCGMFEIASYRIEQAMIGRLENISIKNEIIYRKIIYAIDIHRKAIEFSTFLMSNFERLFFFLIAFSVSCLSLNLVQVVSFGHSIEELLFHLGFAITVVLYMFLANYVGQEITDHSKYIFFAAYNVRWYLVPVHTQKLILFILQRSNKVFSLNVGGLFAASLECFATLASASMSYFTVMYSTQQ